MKLALVALLVGAGACVADDPTSARVDPGRDVTPLNVADEVELPTMGPDNIDFAIVTITGVEEPGRVPTQPNIDLTNVDIADLTPEAQRFCALADELPGSDVCSSLCDSYGFTARLFENGTPGGCQQVPCQLPGGVIVNTEVCLPPNN